MKKKLFSFIIAFAFILTGAMCLTACGGDPPAKTLENITCEVNHEKFSGGQFNYSYGDTINISKSNFTVTANYSDNTSETVNDYTLNTSSIPSGVADIGSYTVIISYSTANPISYNVIVSEKQLNADLKSFLEEITVEDIEYTGEEINILDRITGLNDYLNASDSQIEIASSSTIRATEKDTYYLTIQSKQGYETYSKTITWKIVDAQSQIAEIAIPTLQNASVEYDGLEHGIELVFAQGTPQEAIDSISIYSGNVENKTYTDAGTYDYSIQLDSDKYCFPGEQSWAQLKLTITKKVLNYNAADLKLTSTPTYLGRNLTLADVTHNVDTNLFDVTFSSGINAGEGCSLYIQAKESTANNYCWKDRTDIGFIDSKNYTIAKAAIPDYATKASEILTNAVITKEYESNSTFSQYISNGSSFDDSSKAWMRENIDFSQYDDAVSISIATENIPNGENAITNTSGVSFNANVFAAGEYNVWIDYNPDTSNYQGSTKIKIKFIVNKKPQTIYPEWEIVDGGNLPFRDNGYTNILMGSLSGITQTDYYKANRNDDYVEVPKGSGGYATFRNIGFYKSVATYKDDFDNYDITINDAYNGTYTITNNIIEFVSEFRIYDPNVQGKQFTFADLKILKEDGSELTDDELTALTEETKEMTNSIKTSNLGKTANCDTNGKVSGSCDFGGGSFDELITPTAPDVTPEPYYYTYSSTRENAVEMFVKDGDNVIEASKLVGNLVGDTLTLTMQLLTEDGSPTGYVWQFTFIEVEAE